MGRQPATSSPDVEIARLLERQGGVGHRDQLLAAGVTARMIQHRLARGTLRSVHRGVYAIAYRALDREAIQRAAWLAVGETSSVSHLDAAGGWEMRAAPTGPVAVTLPPGPGRSRRRGITLHRAPLEAGDWSYRKGMRITSPARTLIDIAALLRPPELRQALDEAHYRGLVTTLSLAQALERNAGRHGTRALRRLLSTHELGTRRTETRLEQRFVEAYERWGRFAFQTQVRMAPYRLDLFFAAHRCAVEVDGPIHRLETRRVADAARDLDLEHSGIRTIRVPDTEFDADPRAAVERVDRDLLAG